MLGADNLIIDDNIHHLTHDEQDVIMHDLMRNYPYYASKAIPWLSEQHHAWRELDMDLLIKRLNRTLTAAGSSSFRELMKPLSDTQELEQRRVVLKKLIDDQHLFQELHSLLTGYAEHEWLLLSLFDQHSSFYNHIEALRIFRKQFATNTTVLAGSATRFRQMMEIPSIVGVMSTYLVALVSFIAMDVQKHGFSKSIITPFSVVFSFFFSVLPAGEKIISLIDMYPKILAINAAVRTLHGLLIHIAFVIKQRLTLESLVPEECESIHHTLQQWYNFLDVDSVDYCQDLDKLVQLLEGNNFTGVPSANIGTSYNQLWQAYEYLLRCKEKLIPLIYAYGTLDAYLSVPQLYKELQQTDYPLTWVSFIEGSQPSFYGQDIYNPLVLQDNIVTNSFDIGGNNPTKHIMLTGPHGCGKTTSMKSIAYTFIMGQSILLVSAASAIITPVTKIGTYLNIADNLVEGVSSFMAEKQRMKELNLMAKNLLLDDRCLILIDEPYAKTLQVVGEERVYQFVAELYKIPQLMMLVATHFEKPAALELESQGSVANYQPELLESPLGNFTRTFKILKGKATWWFEDARRRGDFIDWLGEVRLLVLRCKGT